MMARRKASSRIFFKYDRIAAPSNFPVCPFASIRCRTIKNTQNGTAAFTLSHSEHAGARFHQPFAPPKLAALMWSRPVATPPQ